MTAGRTAIIERGLEAFTIDDVVRIAGLSKGAFYYYYPTREAFMDALRLALAEDLGEVAHAAAAGPWNGLFGRMMQAARDWLIENEQLRGITTPTYMSDPHRPTYDPLVAMLEQVLRAGIEAGVLRPPASLLPAEEPDALQQTSQMTLDVMRETAARAAASDPGDPPIAAAESFLAAALGLDPNAARRAEYTPRD